MMELFVTDSFDTLTQEVGFTVQGEVVPEQVLTYETDEYVVVLTCRARTDIDPIVQAYDPQSPSSPPAADSRLIARPIVAELAGD